MAIPTVTTLYLHVLRTLKDNDCYNKKQIGDILADKFNLTEKERKEIYGKNRPKFKFQDRVDWAISHLHLAGLIKKEKRGINKITERGLNLLAKNPTEITSKQIKQLKELNVPVNQSNTEKINIYPDEINMPETYPEGAKKTIVVNKYERDPKARKQCLQTYKNNYKCQICGFKFSEKYGEQFETKIHVHHIKPLSEIGAQYEINPAKDLIPVCPNCHLVLHSKGKNEVYSIEEVKQMIGNFN